MRWLYRDHLGMVIIINGEVIKTDLVDHPHLKTRALNAQTTGTTAVIVEVVIATIQAVVAIG